MTKEIEGKKKRWLLKTLVACLIAASAFGLLVYYQYNVYFTDSQSCKEIEKEIDKIVAKQLNKDSKYLTSEDYKKVEYIDISSIRIKNLKPIEKFKYLKSINLMVNQQIDLRPLEKLKTLETLEIFFPGHMSRQPNMYEKFRNRISHPSGNSRISSIAVPFNLGRLEKCKNLESLIIKAKYVRNFPALAELTNMKHLEIETDFTNYNDMQSVSSLINLEYLGLKISTYWTYISPLENLINLQGLDLSGAHISDPNSLKKLTGLKSLKVINTSLTAEQIDELQKALPNLKIEK